MPSARPTLYGSRHAVSAGHYLAAAAGFSILEAGGNAIDAGCAAGIALSVLHADEVNVAGVAPIVNWPEVAIRFIKCSAVSTPSPVVACSSITMCPDCSPPRLKPPAFIASTAAWTVPQAVSIQTIVSGWAARIARASSRPFIPGN